MHFVKICSALFYRTMVSLNLFSLFQQSKLLFKLKLACLSVLGGVQHISSQINKYDNVEIYQ